MSRRAGEMAPVGKAGADDRRFGAWARSLKKGAEARFTLDADFARSLQGRPAKVNLV
jgi:hypothetical protein